jgi:hypothetical protein
MRKVEIYYRDFCRSEAVQCDKTTAVFTDFYEHLNVRTYSEAMCETIGSIMGIAVANGRNLEPANLNKEVFIRFNSPPLHILKQQFVPMVAAKWRETMKLEFYRKGKKRSGLKTDELSHSLESFRSREEEKSHIPVELFKL